MWRVWREGGEWQDFCGGALMKASRRDARRNAAVRELAAVGVIGAALVLPDRARSRLGLRVAVREAPRGMRMVLLHASRAIPTGEAFGGVRFDSPPAWLARGGSAPLALRTGHLRASGDAICPDSSRRAPRRCASRSDVPSRRGGRTHGRQRTMRPSGVLRAREHRLHHFRSGSVVIRCPPHMARRFRWEESSGKQAGQAASRVSQHPGSVSVG